MFRSSPGAALLRSIQKPGLLNGTGKKDLPSRRCGRVMIQCHSTWISTGLSRRKRCIPSKRWEIFQNNFFLSCGNSSLNDIKMIQSLNTHSSPASRINKKVHEDGRRLVEHHLQNEDNRTGLFTTGSEVYRTPAPLRTPAPQREPRAARRGDAGAFSQVISHNCQTENGKVTSKRLSVLI